MMDRPQGALPPLSRFGDSHGSVVMGWVAPQVIYARIDGELSDSLGAAYASRLERAIWTRNGVRLFSDLWQLETYALSARDRLVAMLKLHRKRFTSIDVLVRTTVVTLGVRAAAIVLGSVVQVYNRPAQFMALLEGRAPQLRSLLEPSISPKPDVDWL